MSELDVLFRKLPEKEIPPYLHKKIMRRVFFARMRIPLLVAFIALIVNLITTTVIFLNRFIDMETWTMIKIITDDFRAGYESLGESLSQVWDFVPWQSALILSVNIILVVGILFFWKKTMSSIMKQTLQT